MGYPLEPSREQMREIGTEALSFVLDQIEGYPDLHAFDLQGSIELAHEAASPPPEEGGDLALLLDEVGRGAGKTLNTAGPGHLGYIPGGGLYTAAIGEMIALALNRYATLWEFSAAFVQIEQNVIRWLCDLFAMPVAARGLLTTGGSMANLSAVVAARHSILGEDFSDGVIYTTEHVHASVNKAAMLAGFPRRAISIVPCDAGLRMDVDALRVMIRDHRAAGRRPAIVVASAGTTNTGTVDPLADVAELAHLEGLWLHVDAAYGGFFQLTERGQGRLRGIELADSITLDPHKGMFLPYGTGALVVRDGEALRAAHMVRADYLQDVTDEDEIPSFTDYSPELSREWRGLRVWLPLELHGVAAFRDALDEKLDLAEHLFDALRSRPGFELPWEPELTVVPFRYAPSGADPDVASAELLARVNASGRVFVSSTTIEGRFWIRPCILSFRTHRDRVDEAIEIIDSAAREVAET
jgi:aromatic-L-amino-acid decarboxylase